MDLFHYAAEPISSLEPRTYTHDAMKPSGLWLSVGEDWKEWCEGEAFRPEDLAVRHRVTLKPDANILHLATAEDIDRFTAAYRIRLHPGLRDNLIDWPRATAQHQGIIIAPYCYARRMTDHTFWYYGWDCASGCIWDVSAIQSLEVDQCPEPSSLRS